MDSKERKQEHSLFAKANPVDFLLVLIEFLLGVTDGALQAKIY